MPSAVEAADDIRPKPRSRDASGITSSIIISLASGIGQLGSGFEVGVRWRLSGRDRVPAIRCSRRWTCSSISTLTRKKTE
jgi:hypothetical protein